jgi:two-component system response regulator HydG
VVTTITVIVARGPPDLAPCRKLPGGRMGDSTPATPRGRVLLVDDDRVFGLWATKVLQARGFEVEHVLDPMSGLKQIEAQPWDVVITDVEMPRMSGLEFLERVRRLEPTIPVVVVTAHPTVDRAVTAMRQPGTDFIHKPVSPDDFAAKIATLVTQREPASAPVPQSVLAIGAHPGDVEIGAAGALLAHRAAGAAVTILTLSRGPDATVVPASPESEEAAQAIGTRLGPGDLSSSGGGDDGMFSEVIEDLIAQTQPTVLYAHSIHDTQPEHRNAHRAAMAAARRIGSVYCFQSPSATIDFRPTRFVPIDDGFGVKLRAVGAFAFRAEVRDFLNPDQVTSTAQYWARYCEARHAEAFEVVRDRTGTGVAPGEGGTPQAG